MEPTRSAAEAGGRGLWLTRIGIVVLLGAATLAILQPFLRSMIWAAIVAYMTFGLFRRLRDFTGCPRLISMLFTFGMLLMLGIPFGLFLVVLSEQTASLIQALQLWLERGAALPAWLLEAPLLGPAIETLRAEPALGLGKLGPTLAKYGQTISSELVAILSGVVGNIVAFAMTVIALYVFYVDGEALVAAARRGMALVFPSRPADFLDQIGDVIRAVVFGIVGTAVLQGLVAGIGFAIFQVPYPVILGAATTLLSFVPGGQTLVWAGAAAWLFGTGSTGEGIGMVVWGVVVVGSLDNFARPILIRWSGSADIPFLLILFGVLGGLAAFGLLGLLLGPVVLSVSYTLVRGFVLDEAEHPEHAETALPSGDA